MKFQEMIGKLNAPKIADIYSRAYLTIVATLAPGVNHGILARSTDPAVPNDIIT